MASRDIPLESLSFFIMNYQRIYDQIIDRAKTRKLEGYKEKHHIIPKCIGGTNEKGNLIELTAREHFLCHWLLVRLYPKDRKLAKAFNAMCILKKEYQQRYTPSSRVIFEAKELDRQARKGVKKSKEVIEKRTATRKEKGNYRRTEESVQKGIETRKIRGSYIGKVFTEEHRSKLSKKKQKPIKQYNLEGDLITEYPSLTVAAKTLNISISGISRAIIGKVKNYKNYIWKYA